MAEVKNCYIICYDIRNPKRWRKAYNLLQGYGERIQYSIFRSWLSMRLGKIALGTRTNFSFRG